MKKRKIILIILLVAIIIPFLGKFYYYHKTCYLQVQHYNRATDSFKDPDCIELQNVSLKGYPNQAFFSDERIVKKVLDYLSSIPLVRVTKEEYDDHVNSENGTFIFFYDNNKKVGFIIIRDEEYISGYNDFTYKVKDKGTKIVSGFEQLDFD